MTTGDADKKEILMLPPPRLKVTQQQNANAFLRLAVIHKMSIPDRMERNVLKRQAEKELRDNELLFHCNTPAELDLVIQTTAAKIHDLTKQIRMFERNRCESGRKNELILQKKQIQKNLSTLNKFNGIRILPEKINECEQNISRLDEEIDFYDGKEFKEKQRLENEKDELKIKLESLNRFNLKILDIFYWKKSLYLSKKAICSAWAIETETDRLAWIVKFYSSLIEIEAQ